MEVGGGLIVGRVGGGTRKGGGREESEKSEFSHEKGLEISQTLSANAAVINKSDAITD